MIVSGGRKSYPELPKKWDSPRIGLRILETEVRNKMSDEDIQGLMRFLKDGCGMESEPVWLDIHSGSPVSY